MRRPILSDNWKGLDAFFTPARRSSWHMTPTTRSPRWTAATAQLAVMCASSARADADRRAAARRALGLEQVLEDDTRVGRSFRRRRAGTRIQPLAFSKELLPFGCRIDGRG